MTMNKETFEKLALVDKIHIKSTTTKIKDKAINETGYMILFNKEKFHGATTCLVRQYPDVFELAVIYDDRSKNFNLSFDTEDEAYAMMYRCFYMPETINRDDLIQKIEENLCVSDMTIEEAKEIRKDIEELDKQILETDECTKGEKLLYRFLSTVTKILLPK